MFSPILFLIFALLCVMTSALPGGWSIADPHSPEVISETQFAVDASFPNEHPKFTVLAALQQVVSGMNYDITVEVSPTAGCQVRHFRVYDRFGQRSLVQNDLLTDKCGAFLRKEHSPQA